MSSESGRSISRPAYTAGNLPDFISVLKEAKRESFHREKSEYYFRGHSRTSFQYIPSLLRDRKFIFGEANAVRRIMLEHPSFFDGDEYLIDKLSKLRHIGFPTRLLDVTTNAFVALYFSCCENQSEDGEVGIFHMEYDRIKYRESDTIAILAHYSLLDESDQNSINLFINQTEETIFAASDIVAVDRLIQSIQRERPYFKRNPNTLSENLRSHFVLDMPAHHERIRAQSGAYIMFGIDNDNANAQEVDLCEQSLAARIIIPRSSKEAIKNDLWHFGINHAKLFPDAENKVREFCQGMWVGQ